MLNTFENHEKTATRRLGREKSLALMNHAANGTGPFAADAPDTNWDLDIDLDLDIDEAMLDEDPTSSMDDILSPDRARAAAMAALAAADHVEKRRSISPIGFEDNGGRRDSANASQSQSSSFIWGDKSNPLESLRNVTSKVDYKGSVKNMRESFAKRSPLSSSTASFGGNGAKVDALNGLPNLSTIQIHEQDPNEDDSFRQIVPKQYGTIGGRPITRKLLCVALVAMAGLIVTLSVALTAGKGNGNGKGTNTLNPNDNVDTPPLVLGGGNTGDTDADTRYHDYSSLIIGQGWTASDQSLLDANQPQAKALHWLAYEDQSPLDPSTQTSWFKNKYALVTFYYAAIADSPDFPRSIVGISGDRLQEQDPLLGTEDWLSAAPGAVDADTWYCHWVGIKCEEGDMGIVKVMNLTKRGLVGSIPEEIGQGLDSIKILDLGGNAIEGQIPDSIGEAVLIEQLYLGDNKLVGTIPTQVGMLQNLEDLYLHQNFLAGKIPEQIGQLVKLDGLGLYGNQLTGTIPESIGNLVNIYVLYLDDNKLSGPIPKSIGNLDHVSDIRLRQNRLSGAIPEEIRGMQNLELLYFDSNELSGELPSAIASLNQLKQVHLYKNKISGTIPSEMGNLEDLELLYMDNNELSGEIPPTLGGLKKLESIYLFNNTLSGFLPVELGNMEELKILRLNNNKFSGTVPANLFDKLVRLELIYLNNNNFSGEIPVELEYLRRLEKLRMQNNDFTGVVPPNVCLLREGQLDEFISDCSVTCDCCTSCQ